MKNFHNLTWIVLSITMITLITGCGGGGNTTTDMPTTGTVSLRLADDPIEDKNIIGVYITIDALRYQYADNNDTWEDVDLNESITINLLDLKDGNTTLLNHIELPCGKISHIRFVLNTNECYVDLAIGGLLPLDVPNADEIGFKAIGEFTIESGSTVNITANIDVEKSIIETGDNEFTLQPSINIIDNIDAGKM